MSADDMIDDVLLILGEECAADGSCGDTSLRDRIRLEIESCAARAVMETPRESLTGWKPLPPADIVAYGNGGGAMNLPEDFLFLGSLRLGPWRRGVTTAFPAGHWLEDLQMSDCPGIRAVNDRPLSFHHHSRGRGFLTLYPFTEGDTVAEGWYMPLPATDAEGNLSIPPAAYRQTLSYIVETLRI